MATHDEQNDPGEAPELTLSRRPFLAGMAAVGAVGLTGLGGVLPVEAAQPVALNKLPIMIPVYAPRIPGAYPAPTGRSFPTPPELVRLIYHYKHLFERSYPGGASPGTFYGPFQHELDADGQIDGAYWRQSWHAHHAEFGASVGRLSTVGIYTLARDKAPFGCYLSRAERRECQLKDPFAWLPSEERPSLQELERELARLAGDA